MLNRKQVIDLAEEAGLVFNTEIVNSGYKVTPRHGAALWKFYKLLKAEFEKGTEIKRIKLQKKTTEYDNFKFQYDTSIDGSDWDRIVVKGIIEYTRVHPDRGTWDSDFDYYGYNELGTVVIDWIELNDSEILLTDLKTETQKDLISALDDYLDEIFNLQ